MLLCGSTRHLFVTLTLLYYFLRGNRATCSDEPACYTSNDSNDGGSVWSPEHAPAGHPGACLVQNRTDQDVVFLLEHPYSNESLQRTKRALSLLLIESKRPVYQDFNTRYAFVVYDLSLANELQDHEDHVEQNIVIHNFHPSPDLDSTLNLTVMEHSDTGSSGAGGKLEETEREMAIWLNHLKVRTTLDFIAAVVRREVIPTSDTALQYRGGADLHVINVMDAFNPHQLVKSKAGKHNPEANASSLKPIQREILESIAKITDAVAYVPFSLSVFYDSRSIEPAKTYIGDPSINHCYSDCTHFNKAQTLKSLLSRHSQGGSTLQAHLLSRGAEAKVNELTDLDNEQCVLGLNSATWTGFGLQTTFSNKCLKAGSPILCPVGSFCSPLHGCVANTLAKDHSHEEFEGRAPLSAEFHASHADLAIGKLDAEDALTPSGPLSINTLPATPGGASTLLLSEVVSGSPQVLKWSPDKPFIEMLIRKKQPTVLRNSVVREWKALEKWNFTYLSEHMKANLLEAVKCTNDFLSFDPDLKSPLKLNIPLPFALANMSKEMFFHCIEQQESCPDGYQGHYYFTSLPEELASDVMPNTHLYHTAMDYEAKKQFMWVSSKGMITHGHFDQDFNVFVQVVGEKRFTLWPPSQHELLYSYPRVHPLWHKSRINFRSPDTLAFPQFAKSKALQVTLKPGDLLFVPPYTWHYVETLSPSVSLSTWSHDYELYDHMNSIYRHDHKFDLLKNPKGMYCVKLNV